MATLTQVAINTRKVIRWGTYLIIFLVIGKFLFDLGYATFRRIFPAPPPPPTLSFGKLPKLPFPDKPKPGSLSFTLETPEGGLPKLAVQAKVYFMPKPAANLLALDAARDKAKNLGFDPTAEQISETVYRFHNKEAPSTLEINIVTGAFSISYSFDTDSSPLQLRPPAPEVAASEVRSYLSSASLLPDDLTGPTTHEFLKPQEGKFVPALSLSDSNLVKIKFFRKDYDSLPSLTSDPNQANVWFFVSGQNQKSKQIVSGEFHYFKVDEGKFATYPLKTPQEAWDELNKGNPFVASLGGNQEGDNIKIRRVFLAYYDSSDQTDFFQPIVVFEGDKDFLAYIPAVTPQYYGE